LSLGPLLALANEIENGKLHQRLVQFDLGLRIFRLALAGHLLMVAIMRRVMVWKMIQA